MNKFYKFNFILIFFTQIMLSEYEHPCQYPILFSDFVSIQEPYIEGFLSGTLVKTLDGYVAIEDFKIGNLVAGTQGAQEIVNIKQFFLQQYIGLQLDSQQVFVAPQQKFYLIDGTLLCASDLQLGDILQNGSCVCALQWIETPTIGYCLSTQEHSFSIYPNVHVHNFDFVTISAAGSVVLGVVEICNPVVLLVGILVPLTAYAVNYFRSNLALNYAFEDQDYDLSEVQISLKSIDVVQQTRSYYECTRKKLVVAYQDLSKIKNDLDVFIKPNYANILRFSTELLSQIKPLVFNISMLPDIFYEHSLNIADKEKLMKVRDIELEKLEQEIHSLHLTLAFHVNEIIERRDLAAKEVLTVNDLVSAIVDAWNVDLSDISYNTALHHYAILFSWQEVLDNLEKKTQEVQWIISYYTRLKKHFFVNCTTNLADILSEQIRINNAHCEYVKSSRSVWTFNLNVTEGYLRKYGLLSQQLIDQYRNKVKQYRATQEQNVIFHAKKKQQVVHEAINQDIKNKQDKKSGGGPDQDPDDDDDPLPIKNQSMMMHIFRNKEGHLLDTLENRDLLRKLIQNSKNYLGQDLRENHWYAEILKNGKQLWAWVRNNMIRDGGLNETPRVFNTRTGLCADSFIKNSKI